MLQPTRASVTNDETAQVTSTLLTELMYSSLSLSVERFPRTFKRSQRLEITAVVV